MSKSNLISTGVGFVNPILFNHNLRSIAKDPNSYPQFNIGVFKDYFFDIFADAQIPLLVEQARAGVSSAIQNEAMVWAADTQQAIAAETIQNQLVDNQDLIEATLGQIRHQQSMGFDFSGIAPLTTSTLLYARSFARNNRQALINGAITAGIYYGQDIYRSIFNNSPELEIPMSAPDRSAIFDEPERPDYSLTTTICPNPYDGLYGAPFGLRDLFHNYRANKPVTSSVQETVKAPNIGPINYVSSVTPQNVGLLGNYYLLLGLFVILIAANSK